MKRWFRWAAAVALISTGFTVSTVRAQDPPGDLPATAETTVLEDGYQLWLVEMASPPTSDGGDLGSILGEQSAFRTSASQAGVRYRERKAYSNLWNGLSLEVNGSDVGKLRRMGNVRLYPNVTMTLPDIAPEEQVELTTALAMTGANVAQSSLGLTGAGIRVGIIDTGIDYDHADLGGDGIHRVNSSVFPTPRVVAGHDFVGDLYNTTGIPVADAFPDDCAGHGTHVAGIVGASGGITGVAPGVVFGAYRVIGCGNSTSADLMISAMEMALADNMDVVNMSIGSSFQWPSYPTATAADRLVKKGVVVVCSFGNSGALGLYSGSAPGVGLKTIGVASFDNTHTNSPAFSATPDGLLTPFGAASGCPPIMASGTFPLARTGTQTTVDDACAPLAAGSLSGKVALIRRGTCGFYFKAFNAQNAGAVAVIIYNNAAGSVTPNVAPPTPADPPITIPVISITQAAGNVLDTRLASGPVDITFGYTVSTVNANGGFISSFSSIGLPPDLSVKANLGAPGGSIRSTVPLNQGAPAGYGLNSGTSMASPHVAGAAALLLQAQPNTPAQAVGDILEGHANPRGLSPTQAFLNLVHRQGAGLLDIVSAVLSTNRVEPAELALGETEGAPVTRSFTISNESDHEVSYALSHEPALASGPSTFPPISLFNAPSAVSYSVNPVVVPAHSSVTVDVTVSANAALLDRSIFGGYVRLTPNDGGEDCRVRFAGIKGDYQSIPHLTPVANGFPWLAKRSGSTITNQPGGASYTMMGQDFPVIAFHLDHGASRVVVEVTDVATGETRHNAYNFRDQRRNAAQVTNAAGNDFFFTLTWDGSTFHGQHEDSLPNGQYRLKLSVLKALGDENNPAHWESWTSPIATIARPNLLVEDLAVSRNSVQSGDEVTVSAKVRNNGAVPFTAATVGFYDNDVLIGESTVDLAAGASQAVETQWLVGEGAQHRLRVRVTTSEFEASPGDNEVGFDINVGQAIVGVGGPTPRILSLAPASPNPFHGKVGFRFALPVEGPASLDVFDLAGRRIKGWRWSALPAGEHTVEWDGRGAPAGAILFRLNAMGRTLTQKAVRLQ